jgi:hypothetical protein
LKAATEVSDMRLFVNGMKTSFEPFEREREIYREKNKNPISGKKRWDPVKNSAGWKH